MTRALRVDSFTIEVMSGSTPRPAGDDLSLSERGYLGLDPSPARVAIRHAIFPSENSPGGTITPGAGADCLESERVHLAGVVHKPEFRFYLDGKYDARRG